MFMFPWILVDMCVHVDTHIWRAVNVLQCCAAERHISSLAVWKVKKKQPSMQRMFAAQYKVSFMWR